MAALHVKCVFCVVSHNIFFLLSLNSTIEKGMLAYIMPSRHNDHSPQPPKNNTKTK